MADIGCCEADPAAPGSAPAGFRAGVGDISPSDGKFVGLQWAIGVGQRLPIKRAGARLIVGRGGAPEMLSRVNPVPVQVGRHQDARNRSTGAKPECDVRVWTHLVK